jgi:2-dehydropantoate 2-reductase
MRIAVLGGAGAMGGLFGGQLARSGTDVTLVDVAREAVEAINRDGLQLTDKVGETRAIKVRATTDPAEVGVVDVVMVFVKCYHTELAVRNALPMIGEQTAVLTLQNGWGNVPRIASIVGESKLLAGVTYCSGKVLGPGKVHFTSSSKTFIGELNGSMTDRLTKIHDALSRAGFEVVMTNAVTKEIWSKLVYNCTNLAVMSVLRFLSGETGKHEGTVKLAEALLKEAVAVANAQGIALDFNERWQYISSGMARAAASDNKGKASMLQDVEGRRQTEIDVINGAIVEAGLRLGIPTPYNQAMVWLIRSLQETF